MYGHINVVEYLVNIGADINSKSLNHETSLHYSAIKGHLSVVEYLINHRVDINALDQNNLTPLHYSTKWPS